MNIIEAIEQRHPCRSYTDKTVTKKQIDRILNTASLAPSGANTQPWQVAVLQGRTKETLQKKCSMPLKLASNRVRTIHIIQHSSKHPTHFDLNNVVCNSTVV
jgi:nitroreductase